MLLVDIDGINLKSPYTVRWAQAKSSIVFSTARDVEYIISFIEDTSIFEGLVVFNLLLHSPNRPLGGHRSYDKKIQETVFCILDDFLSRDHRVVIYICDVSDNLQAQRCRLFVSWAKEAGRLLPERFAIESVAYPDSFYGGIVSRTDNPYFEEYIKKMRLVENDKQNYI